MQTLHTVGTEDRSDASSIFVAVMSNDFDTFGVVPLGQHGGRRPGAGRPKKGEVRPPKQPRSVLNSPSSSSFDYITRRLARDARDGCREAGILLEGIHRGLISAHTAACEMNYCQRREPTGRGSQNVSKRIDWALHKLFNPHRKSKHMPENALDVASSAEG
jgi:hypothetical protein